MPQERLEQMSAEYQSLIEHIESDLKQELGREKEPAIDFKDFKEGICR